MRDEPGAAPPEPARRSILDWFLATGSGALAIAILDPVARYLVPPATGESSAASVTLPVKPDEVKANSGTIFQFGSRPGILVRTPSGELRAFSAVCTHLACTVQYRPDLRQIWCACHNGHYDLNGVNVSGPPPRPLEEFAVNVQGGRIVVRRGQ